MITERKSGSDNECKGIQESAIIPILLSSISSTELCLMLLIERDKKEQKIFYRSRNCQLFVENRKYCISCQELFDSLNHFHHLHLKKPCERFHQENSAEVLEQKTVKELYNVSLTTPGWGRAWSSVVRVRAEAQTGESLVLAFLSADLS